MCNFLHQCSAAQMQGKRRWGSWILTRLEFSQSKKAVQKSDILLKDYYGGPWNIKWTKRDMKSRRALMDSMKVVAHV